MSAENRRSARPLAIWTVGSAVAACSVDGRPATPPADRKHRLDGRDGKLDIDGRRYRRY